MHIVRFEYRVDKILNALTAKEKEHCEIVLMNNSFYSKSLGRYDEIDWNSISQYENLPACLIKAFFQFLNMETIFTKQKIPNFIEELKFCKKEALKSLHLNVDVSDHFNEIKQYLDLQRFSLEGFPTKELVEEYFDKFNVLFLLRNKNIDFSKDIVKNYMPEICKVFQKNFLIDVNNGKYVMCKKTPENNIIDTNLIFDSFEDTNEFIKQVEAYSLIAR